MIRSYGFELWKYLGKMLKDMKLRVCFYGFEEYSQLKNWSSSFLSIKMEVNRQSVTLYNGKVVRIWLCLTQYLLVLQKYKYGGKDVRLMARANHVVAVNLWSPSSSPPLSPFINIIIHTPSSLFVKLHALSIVHINWNGGSLYFLMLSKK